jgi:DNA ligase-1
VNVEDLIRAYWLSVIKIGPDYEKNELGVGKEILTKAISKSCGKSEKQIRDSFQIEGDLGEVAMKAKLTQKTMDSYFIKKKEIGSLTINRVFDTLVKISRCKGNNSATDKENMIMKLLMDSK